MRRCDRCGRENADDARFCQACGAPLADEPAPEERKVVSALFVDVVGSTARADGADPEDVRDRLRAFYEVVRGQVDRFGGVVEKFVGDAVVAVFGAPLTHGDDAERAVRAGTAALEAVARLREDEPSFDIEARAGVATGEAVVALGSGHERGEALATGDVLNTAARLQAAAPPGRLIVGSETHRATRRVIAYEAIDPVVAKGKAEPVEAWLAVGELVGEPTLSHSPFVGRERELDDFGSAWSRVTADRRPKLVTIFGPPGIGKSRLAREFERIVTAAGGVSIRGRSLPYDEQTGYRASAQHIKAVADILETDTPDVARVKLARAVSEILPDEAEELVRYLSLLLGLGLDPPSDEQLALFFAVRRVIEAIAARAPTMLVFEDLHWAEPSELDLLDYLVKHVRDQPVLFLALSRPELLDLRPTYGTALLGHTTMPLEPLSDDAAAGIAAATLGGAADRAATIRTLVAASGGNPLFVEELSASIAEGAQASDALPTTVREAIASRIDILPPAERTVLLDASVIGRTFWRGVLRSIGEVERLDDVLDALEARDLIRHEPHSQVEGDREFSFKHVLIRDVAYGTLPRATRRERHAAVATFLEREAGDHIRDVAWILAYHWREAGETDRAVGYLTLAAERALEGMAKDEAIRLYDEAMNLVEDPSMRARVRLQRALSLIELTDFEPGTAEIDLLVPDLAGTDRIDALLARARASIWLEQLDEGFAAVEEARALAEADGDEGRVVAALGYTAGLETLRGRIEESIAIGEEAQRRWLPGMREGDLAVAKEFLADSLYWRGDYERAAELARQAHEMGDQGHSIEALLRGGGWRGVSLAALGRTEDALELLDELIDTADRIGRRRFGAPSLNYSALPLRDLFLVEDARARNLEALETVRQEGAWGMPGMQAEIDLLLADLMTGDLGRVEREWPHLWDEAINGATWRPWLGGTRLAYVRADMLRQREDREAAIEAARDCIDRAVWCRRRKYEALARALLGEALVATGAAEDGLAELRAAVEGSDALGTPALRWQHRAVLGAALYSTGDDEGAESAYREAAAIVRAYAADLSETHALLFLDAEPVRAVLAAGS